MLFCLRQDHQKRIQGTSELIQNAKILQRKTMVYQKNQEFKESNFTHFAQPCAADLVHPNLEQTNLVRGGPAEPQGGTRHGRIGGRPCGTTTKRGWWGGGQTAPRTTEKGTSKHTPHPAPLDCEWHQRKPNLKQYLTKSWSPCISIEVPKMKIDGSTTAWSQREIKNHPAFGQMASINLGISKNKLIKVSDFSRIMWSLVVGVMGTSTKSGKHTHDEFVGFRKMNPKSY